MCVCVCVRERERKRERERERERETRIAFDNGRLCQHENKVPIDSSLLPGLSVSDDEIDSLCLERLVINSFITIPPLH